jgi:hypothetical protein
MTSLMPAILGAYHGLNPAMGWLFAVALGLQERRAAAVMRALPPIALGHAVSVALVVGLFAGAALVVPSNVLRFGAAALMFAFAAYLLLRGSAHPRWVGMRIGFRELTFWSFLMSSAHGAGLMLLPLLVRSQALPQSAFVASHQHATHATHATLATQATHGLYASSIGVLGLHTTAMFVAMACAALAVFHFLDVNYLRRVWLNLDIVWVFALLIAGVFTLAA